MSRYVVPGSERSKLRLLIVEDDPLLGPALKKTLSLGAEVTLASSAEDALAHLELHGFDVVVSDVDLGPGRSGLELLALVSTRWPEVRRVAMSGSVHATAETFLEKPLTSAALKTILGRDLPVRPRVASGTIPIGPVTAAHASSDDDAADASDRLIA